MVSGGPVVGAGPRAAGRHPDGHPARGVPRRRTARPPSSSTGAATATTRSRSDGSPATACSSAATTAGPTTAAGSACSCPGSARSAPSRPGTFPRTRRWSRTGSSGRGASRTPNRPGPRSPFRWSTGAGAGETVFRCRPGLDPARLAGERARRPAHRVSCTAGCSAAAHPRTITARPPADRRRRRGAVPRRAGRHGPDPAVGGLGPDLRPLGPLPAPVDRPDRVRRRGLVPDRQHDRPAAALAVPDPRLVRGPLLQPAAGTAGPGGRPPAGPAHPAARTPTRWLGRPSGPAASAASATRRPSSTSSARRSGGCCARPSAPSSPTARTSRWPRSASAKSCSRREPRERSTASRLHRESFVLDLHTHGPRLRSAAVPGCLARRHRGGAGRGRVRQRCARRASTLSVAKAVGDPVVTRWYLGRSPWDAVEAQLAEIERQAADGGRCRRRLGRGAGAARADGKPAVLLGVEGADALDGDVDRVDAWFERGVRVIVLVHLGDNALGTTSLPWQRYLGPLPVRHRIAARPQRLRRRGPSNG